ncbi:MAG: DASS family sodium-coupled anion symporter [Rhodospirillaceae bacterium]|jgi:solute carrier family 13 (sodium-dependent dicarboxylate transporter), member 2/3/5|nr:DASS family sodium-coupled anion symporter [Rhodospirillaceae bacterium]MBT5036300.1 DASS family sodium-coupled anion symporter [Rhodospirillaceae bacterium]MBT6219610.1 DASS family sodium-coupled anion symporter [Rhodospirillaceae bacterium]MBT6363217.1 DASS family sodium-coupled anion symporter [Rhodospirillaceae bacterium]MBT7769954.1 DASS family sodium-coupled anion symporter [Rhodospirillales bacterium]
MAEDDQDGHAVVEEEYATLGIGEGPGPDESVSTKRLIALIAGPAFAVLLLFLPAPEGMKPEAWRLVALAVWMIVWWLGEAVPIPATALLPIPMMPLLGIAKMKPVAANYGHTLIFLFLGGFLLAAAMQRWGLHKRIALRIVTFVGTSPGGIIVGFMAATAFLSMWISNTATTIMMFAVGLSVIEFIAQKAPDRLMVRNFGVALMLGIAYSASIGGVGTLIGTPPNALLASFLQSNYNIQIDFFTWMKLGVPVVLVMLPIAWLLLTRVIFPVRDLNIGDASGVIRDELASLGSMSKGEKAVAIVFACAAFGWIFRKQLASWTGLPINDTAIAMLAATVLFAWPISREKGYFALDWEAARNVPWGVLLLFGGGLALAGGFKGTGLAEWIGSGVSGFDVSTWALVFIVTVAIVYLTEITSNTASTATFLPILGAVAVGLGLDPRMLAIPVALGASMAFMMPVATPPNAIVFSYEDMHLGDMVRAGFWLNIVAILVSFAAMYFLAPIVFGL